MVSAGGKPRINLTPKKTTRDRVGIDDFLIFTDAGLTPIRFLPKPNKLPVLFTKCRLRVMTDTLQVAVRNKQKRRMLFKFMTKASTNGSSDSPVMPRVLVVDDQPVNVQVVGAILGKLECEMVPAFDGPTALKRLELRPPDIILLDVFMPGMDGFETCRQIRANPEWNHIPILFLSVADDKELIVRALAAGAVGFFFKPIDHVELLLTIENVLGGAAPASQS